MNPSFDHDSPFNQIVASYHRARSASEMSDRFYRFFLGKSPEIPPKCAHTASLIRS